MDLSFEFDNVVFNVRCAALIKCNGKILVSKKDTSEYYSLPGGRVKLNESSLECIKRELKEELDYDLNNYEFKLVRDVENFFTFSDGRVFHEYLFIYEVNLEDYYYSGNFTNLENPNMEMIWIDENNIDSINLKPNFAIDIIDNDRFEHIINKGS